MMVLHIIRCRIMPCFKRCDNLILRCIPKDVRCQQRYLSNASNLSQQAARFPVIRRGRSNSPGQTLLRRVCLLHRHSPQDQIFAFLLGIQWLESRVERWSSKNRKLLAIQCQLTALSLGGSEVFRKSELAMQLDTQHRQETDRMAILTADKKEAYMSICFFLYSEESQTASQIPMYKY